MFDVKSLRHEFPFLLDEVVLSVERDVFRRRESDSRLSDSRVFLDSSASTQMPQQVLNTVAKALLQYANVHRGDYDASRITTRDFESAYNVAANLINANSWREIVFGRGTTEMINNVMYSLMPEFRDGDNVVTTRLEHNSNAVPWYGLQHRLGQFGRNVEVRLVDFDKETGELDMSQLEEMVDDRTKLVAVTGASNFLGTKPDVGRIAEIAHSTGYKHPNDLKGSYVLVDAAQRVPSSPVDVQELDCDFLAWSFHKMLVPLGVGGLYVKRDILESMEPFNYGADMVAEVDDDVIEYADIPWRFTAGTANIIGTIAAKAGMYFLVNAGLGNFDDDKDAHARRVETEILLGTRRGDSEIEYSIPPELKDMMVKYFSDNPDRYNLLKDDPRRLEEVRQSVNLAMDNVGDYVSYLTSNAMSGLAGIPGVNMYGPKDAKKRCGLVAFNIDGVDPQSVAFKLNNVGAEVRTGVHCASLPHHHLGLGGKVAENPIGSIRMGFYIYNTIDEVRETVDVVESIARGRR